MTTNATVTDPFTSVPSTLPRKNLQRHRPVASDEEMEYGFMIIFGLLCLTFFLTSNLFG